MGEDIKLSSIGEVNLLFAAIIQRAKKDAMGQAWYEKTAAARAESADEAYDWLHSETAILMALHCGWTAARYRALLAEVEKARTPCPA